MSGVVAQQRVAARAQSFAIQYTSVIILLLAGIIGSFSGKVTVTSQPIPVIVVENRSVPQPTTHTYQIGEFQSDKLFSDSDNLDFDQALAIAMPVLNHDLLLTVTIQHPQSDEGILRAVQLAQYLDQLGIAPDAATITARVAKGVSPSTQISYRVGGSDE